MTGSEPNIAVVAGGRRGKEGRKKMALLAFCFSYVSIIFQNMASVS
jgi:hypothetical protein